MRLARGIDTTRLVSDVLRDYERKRGRAMLHYDVLREQTERFANTDREPVPGQLNADATKYGFKMPLEGFSRDWTLMLGDFAYNTRASLDYLITALVRSTGKTEHKCNQFPICAPNGVRLDDISEWWDNSPKVTRQLKDTPPGTRAALKKLQPFDGVPLTNPTWHPLFALNVLNNRDKHRRLNLLARRATIDFVDADGKPIFQTPPLPAHIAEGQEGDTYTVTLAIRPDYANVDMYLLTTYQVAFDEPPELIGDLVETLTGINQFIDSRVLPTVKALL
jgi:hypothetical protein